MGLSKAMMTCVLCILSIETAMSQTSKLPLVVGVDANYAEGMEREQGAVWRWDSIPRDLFASMHDRGVDSFRTRLWIGDEGPHGTNAASRVITRAIDAGIDPYLVIFLSDDWADLMKQPVPAVWKDLTFEQRLTAVQDYSCNVVKRLRENGLDSHLYEIGNEIDYGICGEYPGKRSKKDPATLSRHIWPRSAQLILSSQAGVRSADPDAKFMLHIAHWWDVDFCVAFFEFMITQGVQVDYAGLSYFPSANIGGSLEISEFAKTARTLSLAINRPIVVAETAYPSTRAFKGQFSRWKYETPGYPLTPEGQRKWVANFLAMCQDHPNIHAVYYWSPEWYGEGMWKGFALFDTDGAARPAWEPFDRNKRFESHLPSTVFLELREDQLFRVPVESARLAMVDKIATMRQQTGGVSVEHIRLLSSTDLVVEDYEVSLRSSLQNNMHLTLQPTAEGLALNLPEAELLQGINTLVADASTTRHRVVLFVRGEVASSAERIAKHLSSREYQVNIHSLPTDAPLKFGMSGKFGTNSADEDD